MAERRMFSKRVIESDAFLGLSNSCQNLYFHLSMNADDDGFVDNAMSVLAQTKSGQKDLDTLIESGFLIHVSKYVYVITHWFLNNNIQKDRFHPTVYEQEKSLLCRPKNIWKYLEGTPLYTENRPEEKKPEKVKKEIVEKKQYGSLCNVLLTDKEYQSLCDDFGKAMVTKKIEDMSLYIGDPKNAKKYSDYNLALRRWFRKDEENQQQGSKRESWTEVAERLSEEMDLSQL